MLENVKRENTNRNNNENDKTLKEGNLEDLLYHKIHNEDPIKCIHSQKQIFYARSRQTAIDWPVIVEAIFDVHGNLLIKPFVEVVSPEIKDYCSKTGHKLLSAIYENLYDAIYSFGQICYISIRDDLKFEEDIQPHMIFEPSSSAEDFDLNMKYQKLFDCLCRKCDEEMGSIVYKEPKYNDAVKSSYIAGIKDCLLYGPVGIEAVHALNSAKNDIGPRMYAVKYGGFFCKKFDLR